MDEWAKRNPDREVVVEGLHDVMPKAFALNNVNTVIRALEERFPSFPMELFLTGKNNFRNDVATIREYKGNRKNAPKPYHYQDVRDFLIEKYGAVVVDGEEADDAIGIRATELGPAGVIVTTDKDLDTIPGWHYNWVKGELYKVSEKDATRIFYTQILTGDSTDNIMGIEGVGPVKAAKILESVSSEKGMWRACVEAYKEAYPEGCYGISAKEAALETARLVYIRKNKGELWEPPE